MKIIKTVFFEILCMLFFFTASTFFSRAQTIIKEYNSDSITDKSHVFSSTSSFLYSCPDDDSTLVGLVQYALKNSLKIRIRGRGHSANGSSIPSKGEILLITDSLTKMFLIGDSLVSVEAGVVMADCRKFLNEKGFDLFTCNEGGRGPTLGGYISAGGIGSSGQPGFWNSVEQIFFIDGNGSYLKIEKEDPYFPWIFGSMGQLGIIHKALIRIKKNESTKPIGEDRISNMNDYHFYWFPFLIPALNIDRYKLLLEDKITQLSKKFDQFTQPKDLQFLPSGILYVDSSKIKPPLIYKNGENFHVLGMKVLIKKSLPDFVSVLDLLRKDIDVFLEKNKLKAYFQVSYHNPSSSILKKYLGRKIYADFYKVKNHFDPGFIFNPGLFAK